MPSSTLPEPFSLELFGQSRRGVLTVVCARFPGRLKDLAYALLDGSRSPHPGPAVQLPYTPVSGSNQSSPLWRYNLDIPSKGGFQGVCLSFNELGQRQRRPSHSCVRTALRSAFAAKSKRRRAKAVYLADAVLCCTWEGTHGPSQGQIPSGASSSLLAANPAVNSCGGALSGCGLEWM